MIAWNKKNIQTETQDMLGFKMTKSGINFYIDQPLDILQNRPEKETNLKYCKQNNKKMKNTAHFITGFNEQGLVASEKIKKQLVQSTSEHALLPRTEFFIIHETGVKLEGEYGLEDHTLYLRDLKKDLSRKNLIEWIKAIKIRRQYNIDDLAVFYRMRLTGKIIEHLLGFSD